MVTYTHVMRIRGLAIVESTTGIDSLMNVFHKWGERGLTLCQEYFRSVPAMWSSLAPFTKSSNGKGGDLMSSTWNKNSKKRNKKRRQDKERRYTVRGIRRDPVDIGKLSKALLGLAMAETERQAQAEHAKREAKNLEPEITSGDESEPREVRDA